MREVRYVSSFVSARSATASCGRHTKGIVAPNAAVDCGARESCGNLTFCREQPFCQLCTYTTECRCSVACRWRKLCTLGGACLLEAYPCHRGIISGTYHVRSYLRRIQSTFMIGGCLPVRVSHFSLIPITVGLMESRA